MSSSSNWVARTCPERWRVSQHSALFPFGFCSPKSSIFPPSLRGPYTVSHLTRVLPPHQGRMRVRPCSSRKFVECLWTRFLAGRISFWWCYFYHLNRSFFDFDHLLQNIRGQMTRRSPVRAMYSWTQSAGQFHRFCIFMRSHRVKALDHGIPWIFDLHQSHLIGQTCLSFHGV